MSTKPASVPEGTMNGVKFIGVCQASFLHWCNLNDVKVENSKSSILVDSKKILIPFYLPEHDLLINIRPDVTNSTIHKRKDALAPVVQRVNKACIKAFQKRFIFLFSEYFGEVLNLRELLVHPSVKLSVKTLQGINTTMANAFMLHPETVEKKDITMPSILNKILARE